MLVFLLFFFVFFELLHIAQAHTTINLCTTIHIAHSCTYIYEYHNVRTRPSLRHIDGTNI